MGFLKDFKNFAMKGNILDLAIAVIIGGAFGSIVSSLVDDVINPLLLQPALEAAHATNLDQLTWGAVKYGKFLAAVIKFILIALVLFTLMKVANSMNKKKEVPPAEPSSTDKLLAEIRDELKKR